MKVITEDDLIVTHATADAIQQVADEAIKIAMRDFNNGRRVMLERLQEMQEDSPVLLAFQRPEFWANASYNLGMLSVFEALDEVSEERRRRYDT